MRYISTHSSIFLLPTRLDPPFARERWIMVYGYVVYRRLGYVE